jgi:cob(I)alamin adenosyltransferase
MKIYTLTGDDGSTSLSGGRRIPKHSLRIEAYGTVDELIAWLGLLRSDATDKERKDLLIYLQSQLMATAASLAWDSENSASRYIIPEAGSLRILEEEIDRMEELLPKLQSFILPGGDQASSHCNIARCVCRRAERLVWKLNETEDTPEIVRKFLNRLSDYLFVLSRLISLEAGNEEVRWTV